MRKLLLLFMSLFSLTYMYAEENVWVLQTDTQVNVPIDEVDYLLAADDDNLFAVVMKSGEMYDGVKKVVFSQTSYISNTPQPTDVRLLSRSVQGQLSLTGLVPGATVQVFAKDDSLGCKGDVGVLFDNDRRLSAKFQCNGSKVF